MAHRAQSEKAFFSKIKLLYSVVTFIVRPVCCREVGRLPQKCGILLLFLKQWFSNFFAMEPLFKLALIIIKEMFYLTRLMQAIKRWQQCCHLKFPKIPTATGQKSLHVPTLFPCTNDPKL